MEVKPAATEPAYQVVYKYPPLHTDGRWIRLVRLLPDSTAENLQCEMVQRRLTVDAGAGGYTAISYCWGSTQIQRQRTKAIEVNGETLMVSTVVEDLEKKEGLANGKPAEANGEKKGGKEVDKKEGKKK